jgi:hypothetical protein
MSPVDRWTTPYLSLIFSHCVPFPLAGAPLMMIRTGRAGRSLASEDAGDADNAEDCDFARG